MRLHIRTRGLELSDDLRAVIARRIRFALARAAGVVREVKVLIADVNGPRGGVDKVCRIHVQGDLPEVIVEQRDAEAAAAVALAAGRVGRAVLRAVHRSRA